MNISIKTKINMQEKLNLYSSIQTWLALFVIMPVK